MCGMRSSRVYGTISNGVFLCARGILKSLPVVRVSCSSRIWTSKKGENELVSINNNTDNCIYNINDNYDNEFTTDDDSYESKRSYAQRSEPRVCRCSTTKS